MLTHVQTDVTGRPSRVDCGWNCGTGGIVLCGLEPFGKVLRIFLPEIWSDIKLRS